MLVFHTAVSLIVPFFVCLEAINDTAVVRVPNSENTGERVSNFETMPGESAPNSESATEKTTRSAAMADRVLNCTSFTLQNSHNNLGHITDESFSSENSNSSAFISPMANRHSGLIPEKIMDEPTRLSTREQTPDEETMAKEARNVKSRAGGPPQNTVDTTEKEIENGDHACVTFKRAPFTSFGNFSASCSTMANQRLCGCTFICVVLNNCCKDSVFIKSTVQTASVPARVPVYCRKEASNSWWYSSPSLLIDSCSQDWRDDEVRDRCTRPQEMDIRSYVPCYSASARFSYLNIYCAHCNNITDCLAWQITFQSRHPFKFEYINTYSKMIDKVRRSNKAEFLLSQPPGTEPFHCVPNVIDRCKTPLKTEVYSAFCRSYYSPVLVGGVIYRNIHCFLCFMHADMNSDTIDIIPRARPNPMCVLLEMGSTHRLLKSGQAGVDEELIIKRIQGYNTIVTFHISVQFTEDFPAPTRLTRETINIHIQRLIMDTIKSNLKSSLKSHLKTFNTLLQIAPYNISELQDGTPLEIHVTVLDDIPVEAISSVNAAIFSVDFDFQFQTGINVSCCYDEKGNKLTGNTTTAWGSRGCAACQNKTDGSASGGSRKPLHCLNIICPLIYFLLRFIFSRLLFGGLLQLN